MGTLWQDIRYGLRMLARSPGFTTVALLSLALGIGANTAIFSVINDILLKLLPVRNPHELRMIQWTGRPSLGTFGSRDDRSLRAMRSGGMCCGAFPYPAYEEFVKEAKGFSYIFAFSALSPADEAMTINAGGVASTARSLMVSGNFFEGYGAGVLIGRPIMPQDDRPDAEPVAVITYRTWHSYYGLDPQVLGRILTVNSTPYVIVGVLPRHFRGPLPADPTEFYVPLRAQPEQWPDRDGNWLMSEDDWLVHIIGRLAPGADEAQARASLDVLFQRVLSKSEARIEQPAISLEDGGHGPAIRREEMSRPLLILQGVGGLVLLIACANLAGLLLARGAARQHEITIRAAIGAGRWRLIRQSLTESLTLSLMGACLGLVLSVWVKAVVEGFLTEPAYARHSDMGIDGNVLIFALALAAVTALLFGLFVALQAGGVEVSAGLKKADVHSAPRLRLGKALVVGQVGLSILLVMGAGLLTRSLVNFRRVNLGFSAENVLVFRLNPLESAYEREDCGPLYDNVRRAIAQIPGVRSVALCRHTLLDEETWKEGITIPDRPNENGWAFSYAVSDGWFAAMGIGLLSGRDFTQADSQGSQRVAVVNQAFARRFFPEENPLGRLLRANGQEYQIVGVCRDHVAQHLRDGLPAVMYSCHEQRFREFRERRTTFVVRSVLPPLSLLPAVRRAVVGIDRNLPLDEVTTEAKLLESDIARERLFAFLCGGLAVLALVLSCIGVYGLMAFNVTRRTGELGIRMALGARPRDVAWPILREALVLAMLGIAMGVPVALILARVLKSVLFDVEPCDPATAVASGLILATVAAVAAWVPARRAAKTDPMVALRYE